MKTGMLRVGVGNGILDLVPMLSKQQGFTYLLVLVMVATLAISTTLTIRTTSTLVAREKEKQLIITGRRYYKAIESFYQASAIKSYPHALDDLVKDPRFPYKSHIRKLYPDPFARRDIDPDKQWQLVTNEMGGIIGVSSRHEGAALRRPATLPSYITIQGVGERYTEWQFIFVPQNSQIIHSDINGFQ